VFLRRLPTVDMDQVYTYYDLLLRLLIVCVCVRVCVRSSQRRTTCATTSQCIIHKNSRLACTIDEKQHFTFTFIQQQTRPFYKSFTWKSLFSFFIRSQPLDVEPRRQRCSQHRHALQGAHGWPPSSRHHVPRPLSNNNVNNNNFCRKEHIAHPCPICIGL